MRDLRNYMFHVLAGILATPIVFALMALENASHAGRTSRRRNH